MAPRDRDVTSSTRFQEGPRRWDRVPKVREGEGQMKEDRVGEGGIHEGTQ